MSTILNHGADIMDHQLDSYPSPIAGYVHRSSVIGDDEALFKIDGLEVRFGVVADIEVERDEDGVRQQVYKPTSVHVSPSFDLMPLLMKRDPELLEMILREAELSCIEDQRNK